MEIEGKKVLRYIIDRLLQVVDKDHIVLATSTAQSDDAIEAFALQEGISCFRGSLEDVADRFYQAANQKSWDYAIRINGDNVFVDTQVLADMIAIARSGEYDFVSNVKDRTFPKGMSIEIVKMRHYASLLPAISSSEYYREHVTLYLYEHEADSYYYYRNTGLPEASGIQMALDTAEDLERTKNIIGQFKGEHWNYNLKEIYTIWKALYNEQSI